MTLKKQPFFMLIGTEFLREVIETVILTGKIKGLDPISLLLIAAPESGKTSVVLSKKCATIKAFGDVTGRGLHQIIKNDKNLTHIVINDLVAVLSHKAAVNKYTISQLNAITEEGITALATPQGIETFDVGKRGIIASLTYDLVKDERFWWNKIGFTSRMLPFCYKYPASLIIKIKGSIDAQSINGKHAPPKEITFEVPKNDIAHVQYSELFSKDIRQLADVRAMMLKEQGMRRLKQYHAMTQAHALWRSRKSPTVTEEDIDFMKKLDCYVSYDTAEPL